MPFDQIYWQGGGMVFAETDYTQTSSASDVRFGKTRDAENDANTNSHSPFEFIGTRRYSVQDWDQLQVRDTRWPYLYFNCEDEDVYRNNGTKPRFNNDDWEENDGSLVSSQRSRIVYGWPGCNTYSTFQVNDMQKTGNNGNNITAVYGDDPTDDELFQAQNRESCHHYTTVANSKDHDNTFCGIHKDYPLTITADKNYNGFYLLLKRKRFHYNESNIKLSVPSDDEFDNILNKRQNYIGLVNTYFDNNGNYLPNNDFTADTFSGLTNTQKTAQLGAGLVNWHDWLDSTQDGFPANNTLAGALGLAPARIANLRDAPCEVDWKLSQSLDWNDIPEGYGSDSAVGNHQNIVGYRRLTTNNTDFDRRHPTENESSVYQNCYNTDTAVWACRTGLDVIPEDTKNLLGLPTTDAGVTPARVLSDSFRTRIPSLLAQQGGGTDDTKTTVRWMGFLEDYNANPIETTLKHVLDFEHLQGTNLSGNNDNGDVGWWFQSFHGWRPPSATAVRLGYGADGPNDDPGDTEWIRMYPLWNVLYATPVDGVDTAGTTLRYGIVVPLPGQIRLDDVFTFWLFSSKVGDDAIWNTLSEARRDEFPEATNTDAEGNAVTKRSLLRGDWFYCNGLTTNPLSTVINQNILLTGPGPGLARWKIVNAGGKYQGIGGTEDGSIPANTPLGPGKTNAEYGVYFPLDDAINRYGNWDDITVMNAVISPEYSVREQVRTGSVYIKNITIEINDVVQKAKDDVLGEYIQMTNREIYSDRGTITATGTINQRIVTFSNLYVGKTTIISRYIDTSFKIIFDGESTEYGIQSVAANGNSITLTSNLDQNLTSSNFTLKIPRGSPDNNYTWGEYRLENFDSTEYVETDCEWLKFNAGGGVDFINEDTETPLRGNVVNDLIATNDNSLFSGVFDWLWWELFMNVSENPSTWPSAPDDTDDQNWQTSWHKIMMQKDLGLYPNQQGVGFTEDDIMMPVRHPFFANELSEGLHNLQDFDHIAFWNNMYLTVSNGNFGHISSKLSDPSTSPTWQGCNYLQYYEYEHTVGGSVADGLTTQQITNLTGFTNVRNSVLTPRLGYGNQRRSFNGNLLPNFNISQFWYGGIDKASSAIWPNYKNNTAQLGNADVTVDAEYTGQNASNFSEWGEEFAEAYPGESSTQVADGPWFAYCAFRRPPNIAQYMWENRSLALLLTRMANYVSSFATEDITEDNAFSDTSMGTIFDNHWQNIWKVKMENHSKHPYVLAQYGWGGDLLGWGEYDGDTRFHVFTIYDSDKVLTKGSKIEVSLEQCPPPFELELPDQFGIAIEDDAQILGYGRGMKPLDNYQLVLVAK